jgi:predicted ABC-type ATPase
VAKARISVLAGVNGAGKSSIAGAMIRRSGGEYFNPDEAARRILTASPRSTTKEANGLAWKEGVNRLKGAIRDGLDFTLETTLGGDTIVGLLERAAQGGCEVRVWFAGLASVELHLSRIESRVRSGGHDIPEADVRRRFRASRLNLIRLLPVLKELLLYDNSRDADPHAGAKPKPLLLVHAKNGRIVAPADLRGTPEWAKPIVAAAMRPSLPPVTSQGRVRSRRRGK